MAKLEIGDGCYVDKMAHLSHVTLEDLIALSARAPASRWVSAGWAGFEWSSGLRLAERDHTFRVLFSERQTLVRWSVILRAHLATRDLVACLTPLTQNASAPPRRAIGPLWVAAPGEPPMYSERLLRTLDAAREECWKEDFLGVADARVDAADEYDWLAMQLARSVLLGARSRGSRAEEIAEHLQRHWFGEPGESPDTPLLAERIAQLQNEIAARLA